jgi:hypothetical protein
LKSKATRAEPLAQSIGAEEMGEESESINGKLFCVTGRLEHFATKNDVFGEIEARGGHVIKECVSRLDYLVLGGKGSPKYIYGKKGIKQNNAEKWVKLGARIKIITEDQLLETLANSPFVPEGERLPLTEKTRIVVPSSGIPVLPLGEFSSYSERFHVPGDEAQLLKITVTAEELNESEVERFKAFVSGLQLKRTLSSLGFQKNRVRTEVFPQEWLSVGSSDGEELAVVRTRIFAPANTAPQKEAIRKFAEAVKKSFKEVQAEFLLELRILNQSNFYAKYWLNKFF